MSLVTALVVKHVVLEILHDGEEGAARLVHDSLAVGTERTLGHGS